MYKCMKQGALHNDHKQSIHIKITHIQSKHRKLLQRERVAYKYHYTEDEMGYYLYY